MVYQSKLSQYGQVFVITFQVFDFELTEEEMNGIYALNNNKRINIEEM